MISYVRAFICFWPSPPQDVHSSDLVDESEDNLYSSEHSEEETEEVEKSGDEHPPTPRKRDLRGRSCRYIRR